MRGRSTSRILVHIQLCGLFFCVAISSYAQRSERNPDLETWSSFNARIRLGEKWEINLKEQLRLKSISSQLDRLVTELEFRRSLSQSWRFTIGLRHLGINDNIGDIQGFKHHFRYHIDFRHSCKSERIGFKNRFRFQRRNELGISSLQGDYPSNYFRLKTSLEINIRKWKWDPILTNEYFYRREIGELNGFNKCRTGIETRYKLSEGKRLKMAYYFERELKIWKPRVTHIITLEYRLNFK